MKFADWVLFFSNIFLCTFLQTLIGSPYTAFPTINFYGITESPIADLARGYDYTSQNVYNQSERAR